MLHCVHANELVYYKQLIIMYRGLNINRYPVRYELHLTGYRG